MEEKSDLQSYDIMVKSNIDGCPDEQMRLYARQPDKSEFRFISSLKRDAAIRYCESCGWKLIDV